MEWIWSCLRIMRDDSSKFRKIISRHAFIIDHFRVHYTTLYRYIYHLFIKTFNDLTAKRGYFRQDWDSRFSVQHRSRPNSVIFLKFWDFSEKLNWNVNKHFVFVKSSNFKTYISPIERVFMKAFMHNCRTTTKKKIIKFAQQVIKFVQAIWKIFKNYGRHDKMLCIPQKKSMS